MYNSPADYLNWHAKDANLIVCWYPNTDTTRVRRVCALFSVSSNKFDQRRNIFDLWFILHTFSVRWARCVVRHIFFSLVIRMEEGILFSIDGSNWFLSSFEKFTCAHFFPPLISFMTLIIFSASISRSVEPLKMFERHRKSDSYIYFCINFKWPFVFFVSCGSAIDVCMCVNARRLLLMLFLVPFFSFFSFILTQPWQFYKYNTILWPLYVFYCCSSLLAAFFFLLIRETAVCSDRMLSHFFNALRSLIWLLFVLKDLLGYTRNQWY